MGAGLQRRLKNKEKKNQRRNARCIASPCITPHHTISCAQRRQRIHLPPTHLECLSALIAAISGCPHRIAASLSLSLSLLSPLSFSCFSAAAAALFQTQAHRPSWLSCSSSSNSDPHNTHGRPGWREPRHSIRRRPTPQHSPELISPSLNTGWQP